MKLLLSFLFRAVSAGRFLMNPRSMKMKTTVDIYHTLSALKMQ